MLAAGMFLHREGVGYLCLIDSQGDCKGDEQSEEPPESFEMEVSIWNQVSSGLKSSFPHRIGVCSLPQHSAPNVLVAHSESLQVSGVSASSAGNSIRVTENRGFHCPELSI